MSQAERTYLSFEIREPQTEQSCRHIEQKRIRRHGLRWHTESYSVCASKQEAGKHQIYTAMCSVMHDDVHSNALPEIVGQQHAGHPREQGGAAERGTIQQLTPDSGQYVLRK